MEEERFRSVLRSRKAQEFRKRKQLLAFLTAPTKITCNGLNSELPHH